MNTRFAFVCNLFLECVGVRATASVVCYRIEADFDLILVRSPDDIKDPG